MRSLSVLFGLVLLSGCQAGQGEQGRPQAADKDRPAQVAKDRPAVPDQGQQASQQGSSPKLNEIARWNVTTAAFSPDGKYLLLGYYVGPRMSHDALALEYLEVASGKRLWATKGQRRLRPVAILPGNRKALIHDPTTLQLWDLDKGQWLETVGKFDSLLDVLFADHSGQRCLIDSGTGTFRVWDVRQQRAELTLLLPGTLLCGAFSRDGQYLLFSTCPTAPPSKTLHFWDLNQRRRLKTYPGSEAQGPVAFSSDGKFAVSRAASRELVVWDVKTRQEAARLESGIAPIAFSQDGKHLVFGQSIGIRSFLQRVEWATNRQVCKVELPNNSRHITVSPDGNWGYSDRPVGNPQALEGLERTVWDLKTGKVWRTLVAPSK